MKKFSIKGVVGNRPLMSAITVLAVLLLLVGNVALAYLGLNRQLYADLTPEGLYTLSDGMVEECSFVDGLTELDSDGNVKKIEILFCTDPDNLISSPITRIPYFMAKALDNKFENVEVDYVNIGLNPMAVSQYKTTSLTSIKPSDIIVSYGGVYRIARVESFWGINDSSVFVSYNGEYRMASLIKSLTAVERPSVYFASNLGAEYYDTENPESETSLRLAAFYDLLVQRGFDVKTIDIAAAERIPEDCVLLVINNPTSDLSPANPNSLYDYSESDKLDEYLTKNAGAMLVTKDPTVKLPRLEQLMKEWGIEFMDGVVKDDPTVGGALAGENMEAGLSTDIVAKYITDENSYAYTIYQEYASLVSAPRFVIPNTGYLGCAFGENVSRREDGNFRAERIYSSFLTSSLTAKAYDGNLLTAERGVKDLVAVTTRTELDGYTATYTYSYLAAANSKDFLCSDVIGNASYANYDIVSALINNISRVDEYASISLGGMSENSTAYGGKMLRSEALSEQPTDVFSNDYKEIVKVNRGIDKTEITIFAILTAIAPVTALAVGITVRVKRKFL